MSKPGALNGLGLGIPSSSRDSSLSPLPSPASHGFRSQFGSLLPRHALFQVHIHIDQLSNVPLVKGQFGVRWKFKNVQSGSGLLAKMRSANSSRSDEVQAAKLRKPFGKKGKWKGTSLDTERDSRSSMALAQSSGQQTPEGPQIEVTSQDDPLDDSDNYDNSAATESRSSHQLRRSSSSSHIFTSYITASPPHSPTDPSPAVPDLTPLPPSAAPTITKASFSQMSGGSQLLTEARGFTEWAKLKNYNVTWDHKINVVVQMDVHRETGDLLPNELKLVVMQRVIHGDPDSPQHPRMGALYLNLAEYVNAGAVTRRYLLRDSKTNATLKLTIELEYLAGTKHYTPPPLPKGEILAEVSGLLSNNDLLKARLARNLDLFNRGVEYPESSSDSSSSTSSPQERDRTIVSTPYTTGDGRVDYDRLAVLNGLHTTEKLIEAIFNPVPTASNSPSPFTYYDPDKAREREATLLAQDTDSNSADTSADSSSGLSMGGNRTSSLGGKGRAYPASERSHSSAGSVLEAQKPHWWQKLHVGGHSAPGGSGGVGSRPGTPRGGAIRPLTPRFSGEGEGVR